MNSRLGLALVGLSACALSQANSLTTLFNENNGGASLWTVYMDLTVSSPNGITITAFDVNTTSGAGLGFSLDVYTTAAGGSYIGNTSNPGAWTLQGSGSGSSAAVNTPSHADTADFSLGAGTYGLAIRYNGIAPAYTNGDGTNQNYSNGDISLALGASQATTNGPFNGGTPFSPRVWNGTIYYNVNSTPEPASIAMLGLGALVFLRRRRR